MSLEHFLKITWWTHIKEVRPNVWNSRCTVLEQIEILIRLDFFQKGTFLSPFFDKDCSSNFRSKHSTNTYCVYYENYWNSL